MVATSVDLLASISDLRAAHRPSAFPVDFVAEEFCFVDRAGKKQLDPPGAAFASIVAAVPIFVVPVQERQRSCR
jgi:hypothetical protein